MSRDGRQTGNHNADCGDLIGVNEKSAFDHDEGHQVRSPDNEQGVEEQPALVECMKDGHRCESCKEAEAQPDARYPSRDIGLRVNDAREKLAPTGVVVVAVVGEVRETTGSFGQQPCYSECRLEPSQELLHHA